MRQPNARTLPLVALALAAPLALAISSPTAGSTDESGAVPGSSKFAVTG